MKSLLFQSMSQMGLQLGTESGGAYETTNFPYCLAPSIHKTIWMGWGWGVGECTGGGFMKTSSWHWLWLRGIWIPRFFLGSVILTHQPDLSPPSHCYGQITAVLMDCKTNQHAHGSWKNTLLSLAPLTLNVPGGLGGEWHGVWG